MIESAGVKAYLASARKDKLRMAEVINTLITEHGLTLQEASAAIINDAISMVGKQAADIRELAPREPGICKGEEAK